MDSTPIVIAEIGAVHAGNVSRAKELVRLAALAGANVAKFQKRDPESSTPQSMWNQPHPNQRFAYGKTYLEHRQNLELTIEQHAELKAYCEQIGIEYSTSVWDLISAREVVELNPKFIKVPSAQNHNMEVIDYLTSQYDGMIHISLGMTTVRERLDFMNKLLTSGLDKRIVVYHCTSAYPCPFEKLYLDEIQWLSELIPHVGFSNHGYGIAADIAALAMGARYFERHFVDDRMFPHTDAAASLEPEGMRRLCRDIKNVYSAFKSKPDGLDELEAEQRTKLRGV